MRAEHRGAVVITGDGTPNTPITGIFTERDVVQFLVSAFPREVLTLRGELGAGAPRQREGG